MQDRFRVRGWSVFDSGYYDDIQNMLFGEEDNMTLLDAISKGLVNEIIPEQCTGLKDKNGKLIYEGDIINYSPGDKVNTVENFAQKIFQGKYVVEFCEYYFSPFNHVNTKTVEVIGNIHENPELLE